MRSLIIAIAAIATLNFANDPAPRGSKAIKETSNGTSKVVRINMTGPSPISKNGGPYTYTVNLSNFGGQIAQGSVWTIRKNGAVYSYAVSADVNATGTIS